MYSTRQKPNLILPTSSSMPICKPVLFVYLAKIIILEHVHVYNSLSVLPFFLVNPIVTISDHQSNLPDRIIDAKHFMFYLL